jgi:uncharacterized protein YecT (DUF1311 family)
LKTAGTEERKALKKAQTHWLNYKAAEEAFIALILIDKDEDIWREKSLVIEIRAYDLILEKYGDNGAGQPFVRSRLKSIYGEDLDFEHCIGNGSNIKMSDCGVKFAKIHEKKLTANYNKLIKILPKEASDKLKDSQREWQKFRAAEVSIYHVIPIDMGGGNLYGLLAVKQNMELIRRRSIDLEKHIRLLEE